VEDNDEIEHRVAFVTSLRSEMRLRECADWCGGGDLDPYALRL
jgi:hypothetical protein